VQIIRDIIALRNALAALRAQGGRVALVPTMGALHDGHMALIRQAHACADHVIASIFVNPKQFGANEDLSSYPRQEEADARLLTANTTAILWTPPVDVMYPAHFSTNISVSGVSNGLCGAARPGHFDGVATVVCKLLNQVQPDIALFGEKDYQQLAVIRRFVRDLDIAVEIASVPTMRAADGLALSSRNAYLTKAERAAAVALPQGLIDAAARIAAGNDVAKTLADCTEKLISAGFASVDYVTLADAETLEPLTLLDRPARLLAAARIGATRLIDNFAVNPAA
jgi:pantoate--beta-alanine ligase